MQITDADLAKIAPGLAAHGGPDVRPHLSPHVRPHTSPRRLLNIGAGAAGKRQLPECFRGAHWVEVRLDLDPATDPHIVGHAANLARIASDSFDAVYSSHNLEHLEGYEVAKALSEMHRVLAPHGVAVVTLPNLERVAQLIIEGKLTDTLYTSPAGPISPLDMLFGHQDAIARGNQFMAHRTGFTAARLKDCLVGAGFATVRVRAGDAYDLWAIATKT